jgi:hypothetical protein
VSVSYWPISAGDHRLLRFELGQRPVRAVAAVANCYAGVSNLHLNTYQKDWISSQSKHRMHLDLSKLVAILAGYSHP